MKIFVLAIVVFLSAGSGAKAASRISLPTDVASGWGDRGWIKSLQFGYKDYGFQVVTEAGGHPVRHGNRSIRFEVRPGDCGRDDSWNDCKKDRERHELSQPGNAQRHGDEYWYSWSLFIPAETPMVYPTKTNFAQFHQQRDGVLFMFNWTPAGYTVDNQVPGGGRSKNQRTIVSRETLQDRWIDVLVHAKWSHNADGFFRVYVDHLKTYEHSGQTMARNDHPYFKFGIYRSFMSRYKSDKNVSEVPGQFVYFDEVHRGRSLAKVDRVGLVKLQELAAEKGFYSGSIDGLWGPNTLKAANHLLAEKGAAPVDRYSIAVWDGLNKPDIPPQPQPRFDGHFIELRNALSAGDKALVLQWQTYLYSIGLYRGQIDGGVPGRPQRCACEMHDRQDLRFLQITELQRLRHKTQTGHGVAGARV